MRTDSGRGRFRRIIVLLFVIGIQHVVLREIYGFEEKRPGKGTRGAGHALQRGIGRTVKTWRTGHTLTRGPIRTHGANNTTGQTGGIVAHIARGTRDTLRGTDGRAECVGGTCGSDRSFMDELSRHEFRAHPSA